jgi:DNA modification methylase
MDALNFLRSLPDGIVQCAITSPPYYGLRVYQGGQEMVWPDPGNEPCEGHEWEQGALPLTKNAQVGSDDPKQQAYVDQSDEFFGKVRKGGHEWEPADRPPTQYAQRGKSGEKEKNPALVEEQTKLAEELGHEWEEHFMPPRGGKNHPDRPSTTGANRHMSSTDIRGVGIWSAFCKRCGAWKGSLGLEPTPEMFVHHLVLIFRELRRVLRDDGCFWLNIGDSYCGYKGDNYSKAGVRGTGEATHVPKGHDIGTPHTSAMKPKDLMGIPWRVALALQADGWYLRSAIPWIKGNAMPEAVKDRPTTSHEHIFLLSKSPRYYYDLDAIRMPILETSLARNQYAWNSKQRTHAPKERRGEDHREPGDLFDESGRNRRTGDWFEDSIELLIEEAEAYIHYLKNFQNNGGLLHGSDGTPLAIFANPKPFSEAHFAVFPDRLVEPLIKAGTPTKSCSTCRTPWQRKIEKSYTNPVERNQESQDEGFMDGGKARKKGSLNTGEFPTGVRVKTVGWEPGCDCESNKGKVQVTEAPIVLDPFLGSGTVGIVAEQLGRRWLGSDISIEYCQIALKRFKKEGAALKADAFFDL